MAGGLLTDNVESDTMEVQVARFWVLWTVLRQIKTITINDEWKNAL